MWSGYAEETGKNAIENVLSIRDLFKNRILDGIKDGFHTSGHADIQTLKEVCQAVSPALGVIPIHKDAGMEYDSDGYRVFKDGKSIIDDVEIIVS